MCPIFQVSNVSGENLDLIKMFMNLLQISVCTDVTEPAEFQIDSTFSVPVSDMIVHLLFPHTFRRVILYERANSNMLCCTTGCHNIQPSHLGFNK